MLLMLSLFLLLTAMLAGAYFYWLYSPLPAQPGATGELRRASMSVDDLQRTFSSYVPTGLKPGAPLLLVLHGQGIDGARMRIFTGYQFERLADKHGFVVVYPDGYGKGWNDCRKSANTPSKLKNVDDVGFLRSLVEYMQRESGIDATRVYAMGYSNGGQMAYRLLAEQPLLLAGLAVAGANLPIQQDLICHFSAITLPIMLVSGTADSIIPYNGGEISLFGRRNMGSVTSSQHTAEFFAAQSGAEEHRRDTLVNVSDGTAVEKQIWSKGGQAAVVFYTIHGGGHVIPQTAYRFPRLLGKTSLGFDMPAASVEFFNVTSGNLV